MSKKFTKTTCLRKCSKRRWSILFNHRIIKVSTYRQYSNVVLRISHGEYCKIFKTLLINTYSFKSSVLNFKLTSNLHSTIMPFYSEQYTRSLFQIPLC